MEMGGKAMLWEHVVAVWEMEAYSNLRTSRLTEAHVQLNSYSCMKAGMAAQTMSQSVAERMHQVGEAKFGAGHCPYCSTEAYIRQTDALFDLGNIRSAGQGREAQTKKKPMLETFKSSADPRLAKFAEIKAFFGRWLEELWELAGNTEWTKFISQQCHRMVLTNCTTFPEMISWLLDVAGFGFVMTARFNQDPLESMFAEVRQYHGGMRNPPVGPALASLPMIAHGKAAQATFKRSTNVNP
jgi:hypothetical protein